jgi:hypothetical protein
MKLVYAARDSVPEDGFPKVQKIPQFESGQPEIGLNLLFMGGNHSLHGLDLQKNHPFHNKVHTKSLVESSPAVSDRHRHLTFHVQAKHLQFMTKDDFINRFKKTRAEFPVNGNRRFQNFRPKIAFLHFHLCVSAPLRGKSHISLMKRPPGAGFTCRPNSRESRREETAEGGSPQRVMIVSTSVGSSPMAS